MPTSSRGFLQTVLCWGACLWVCLGLGVGWQTASADPWLRSAATGLALSDAHALPRKGSARGGGRAPSAPAKSSLERGIAALGDGDLAVATRLLTEAFRQSPRPEVLYHLGRVASAQGQTLIAYDLFRRYLADPSREPDEAAAQLAEKAIASPPPASGSIAIQSDPGALVLVDDRIVGTLPLPLPVLLSAGAHTVVLEFPGKRFEAPVQVQASRVSELRISRGSGAVLISVLPAILLASQQPQLSPETGRRLTDALEQAARVEQHTLLGLDTLLPQPAERDTCQQTLRCVLELARKNKLSWVLQQRITAVAPTPAAGAAQSPLWNVSLRLLHVDVVEPAAASELSCSSAKLDAALATVKEGLGKLLSAGLSRPRGTLRISANPASAKLRLGGGEPLPLPHESVQWAGSYDLVVTQPGFRPHRESLTLREETPAELRVELQPEVTALPPVTVPPAQPSERAPRPALRLALGGVMVGLGVGMAIVGGLGLLKNGQCSSEPEIDGGTCELRYKTSAQGSFALGSGVLLLGSGVLLMALPGPRRPATPR